MKFLRQSIPDVVLIQPNIHSDDRGYFLETFRQDLFEEVIGREVNFLQDNESKSTRGVLRGLHYQVSPHAQAKLVRVIEGSVLDIAVDIRKDSPTFGKHVSVKLTGDNKHQLFVPRGFAHGFLVLSEFAVFSYKVDNIYAPESEVCINYKDVYLEIDWILNEQEFIISEKDRHGISFSTI